MSTDFHLTPDFLPVMPFHSLAPSEIDAIVARGRQKREQVSNDVVRPIIEAVRARGDAAVLEFTERFDRCHLDALLATNEEIDAASDRLGEELKRAFQAAYANIQDYHSRTAQGDFLYQKEDNLFGFIQRPVRSAAVYVPGGKANYPSSVLMGVTPARIAGVGDITLLTPPGPDGRVADAVLYCARLAGASRVVKAGGAQGIAAAALGTASVPRADLIIGPGNVYVMAAKMLLAQEGQIAIDGPAGPSEVIVIADEHAPPAWVAADLLAQAEHDEDACAILLTTSTALATAVRAAIIEDIGLRQTRGGIKSQSLRRNGRLLVTATLDQALEFSNQYGPEHLELMLPHAEQWLPRIRSAGSVFLGNHAPVAAGDYFSGPNHILPTGGGAAAYSGVSVATFMKRISIQKLSADFLRQAMRPIELMSKAEGLYDEHGRSVEIRFAQGGN